MKVSEAFVSASFISTSPRLSHFESPFPRSNRICTGRKHQHSNFGQSTTVKRSKVSASVRGPNTPAPNYEAIDENAANKQFIKIFRSKLERELGRKATSEGYEGVIEVVKALARRYKGRHAELQEASERVLESLFPRWLPPAFAMMFSRPFPRFAARMNAVVTVAVTQWLMGPSKIAEDGTTVEIERCRYLEESGCVGICVNSCKAATESFFRKNMGLGLAIEPNLEDFSCKFQFGKQALEASDDPMYVEECLSQCNIGMSENRNDKMICSAIPPVHNIESIRNKTHKP